MGERAQGRAGVFDMDGCSGGLLAEIPDGRFALGVAAQRKALTGLYVRGPPGEARLRGVDADRILKEFGSEVRGYERRDRESQSK